MFTGVSPGYRYGSGKLGSSNPSQLLYPDPFFDIGSTYLPNNIKELFKWCKYYVLINPVLNAIVTKLASYSVTDIVINEANEKIKNRWGEFLNDQLHFQSFQINIGLDYEGYGNGLASIHFPFIKMLQCPTCKKWETIHSADYRFENFQFKLHCKHCGSYGKPQVHDRYIRAPNKIKLIRWNPEHIDIDINSYTGDRIYYFTPPRDFYNDVISGRKLIIQNSPQVFLDAARDRRSIIISNENMYHLERSSISSEYEGWGTPRILAVLKDSFYTQLMKKANEVLLMEHVIPLRIIHPQTGDAHANPYEHAHLASWKRQVAREIQTWRRDPNYLPITNFPLGYQQLGGQGKMLLFVNELRSMYEILAAGTGCPQEFVFGGLSYSGSNVSLRMLENDFLRGIEQRKGLLNWVIKKVAHYLRWEEVSADFKPFKMADDLQRLAYYQQLRQSGDISRQSLVTYAGFDSDAEDEIMNRESAKDRAAKVAQQVSDAEAQGKAQEVLAKYQAKVQKEMQIDLMREQAGIQSQAMQQQANLQSRAMKDQMQTQLQAQQQAQQQAMQQQAQTQQGPPGIPQSQLSSNAGTVDGQGNVNMQQAPVDLRQLAHRIASYIKEHPEQRGAVLKNIKDKMGSEMANLVAEMSSTQVDMRPLPEQRPPRRGPESAII